MRANAGMRSLFARASRYNTPTGPEEYADQRFNAFLASDHAQISA
jgi:hypothetical protein